MNSLNISSAATNGDNKWPSPFRYPMEQLQPGVIMELNKNKIDLNDTADSYKNTLRKSLLQILCQEAIRLVRYPNILQKNDLAMCIIESWPHLKEPNGSGYSRWLEGINGTLNSTRQAMGYQRKRKIPQATCMADQSSREMLNASNRCEKVEGGTYQPSETVGKRYIHHRLSRCSIERGERRCNSTLFSN